MNKQTMLMFGALIVLAAALTTFTAKHFATDRGGSTADQVQFTDATTGQSATDLPGEIFDQAPGAVNRPTVTIGGVEKIYDYLSDVQGSNAQSAINNFLMARSGLTDVHAGIKGNTVVQSGNQIQFTLVVNKPQATYQVTIRTANHFQPVPDITLKQEE